MKKFILMLLLLNHFNLFGQVITGSSDGENKVKIPAFGQNADEELKLIIEFTDTPLCKVSGPLRKSAINNPRSVQFRNDLSEITARINTPVSPVKIKQEFYKLFSGAEVEVPRKLIPYISSLPYVKKIHINSEVSADLSESVLLLNADKIWSVYNNKGKGIKISIIDTGIDYKHEALGGGFGPGHKVIAGYDFFNGDNDPMDDHGHGTHVAGIAAANSVVLKGVAPDAELIACKILNSEGKGSLTDVIKGIEYSLDPNNDNDFSDAADIINLSVGGNGTPDDPAAQSVNNAVELGVVVCVAAGNNGILGFHTIDSPGCAEDAITVGNATKSKMLQETSAKGPNKMSYSIKPDILAPGADITSCRLSGGTISYSGTSMATPHIAGICALIKKQHPEWSPEEIKSAITTTAHLLNYEPMEQGSGFADALKAINTGTFVIPASLSYGSCDTSVSVWNTTKKIKVKNIHNRQQQYSVTPLSQNSGITFNITPASFTLSPGDSTFVDFSIAVDNSIVGFNQHGSNTFSGYCSIKGTSDTLVIPWAFLKRRMVEFRFQFPFSGFCISDENKSYYNETWINPYVAQMNLPSGNYDLITCMVNNNSVFFSIKDSLKLSGSDVISIYRDDSMYKITPDARSENNEKISAFPNYRLTFGIYGYDKYANYLMFTTQNKNNNYFISGVPKGFYLDNYEYSYTNEIFRVIAHEPVSDYTGDIHFTNSKEETVKQKVRLLFDPGSPDPVFSYWINADFYNKNNSGMGWGDFGEFKLNQNSWEGYIVRNQRLSSKPTFEFRVRARNSEPPVNDWAYSYITPPMRVVNKNFIMAFENEIRPTTYLPPATESAFVVGDDILYPSTRYFNSYYQYYQTTYFRGQHNDLRSVIGNKYKYRLFNSAGIVVKEGETETGDFFYYDGSGIVKAEQFMINHSRFTDSSVAKLTSTVKATSGDMNPPVITSLHLINAAGITYDEISEEEKAKLEFSFRDINLDANSITAHIKDYYGNTWKSCSLTKVTENDSAGSIYTALLDTSLFRGLSLVSLKIAAKDLYGNEAEWILDPAIKIIKGNFYSPEIEALPDTTIPEDSSYTVIAKITDKDGDSLSFSASASVENTAIFIHDSLITINPPHNWNGTNKITLFVTDGRYSDSTEFNLFVSPVNDPPTAFEIKSPPADFNKILNNDNMNDSTIFVWQKASDPENDTLNYCIRFSPDSFYYNNNSVNDTLFSLINKDIIMLMMETGIEEYRLSWNIYAYDRSDTTVSVNGPFAITFRSDYSPLKISASPDTSIMEDSSYLFRYSIYSQSNNPVELNIRAKYPETNIVKTDSIIIVTPQHNWYGEEEIILSASDNTYTDTVSFKLNVIPVNDKPAAFNLLIPEDNFTEIIDQSVLQDSLVLSWEQSNDIDGDSLRYFIRCRPDSFYINNAPASSGRFCISNKKLYEYFAENKLTNYSFEWNVSTTDGHDTVQASNGYYHINLTIDITGIIESNIPAEYSLENVYPNPFNPAANIKYALPEASVVVIKIYDLLGAEVKQLINEYQQAGFYTVKFDASDLPSGTYFCRLSSGKFTQVRKMLLIK